MRDPKTGSMPEQFTHTHTLPPPLPPNALEHSEHRLLGCSDWHGGWDGVNVEEGGDKDKVE